GAGWRVKVDDSDNSAGWKFSEYEMKGVPLRLEIGPKDIEQNQCVIVRRDTREKAFVSLDELESKVAELMKALAAGIYEKALANIKARTYICKNTDEINAAFAEKGDGFVKAMWCGSEACEDGVKEKTGAGSRCMPIQQEKIAETCVYCGKPASEMVLWGKAY
ncbi:MAG: proline--tRNA ligase, partial [Oscillospiraceae bacterium]|nr:proline--tRNA ligase [Oscillospiraceae bacterium]